MLGKWDYSGVDHMVYSDSNRESYIKAAEFLGDSVEDWGCGTGYAGQYFKNYKGIDGSPSKHIPKENIVDLQNYTSNADNILIRQVLECCGDWQKVLLNAMKSFKRKLCIVISTPSVETTQIGSTVRLRSADNTLAKQEDSFDEIYFNRQDILNYFPTREFRIKEETIKTQIGHGEEWILYVERITR
jgi:hypothetical protein